MPINQSFRYCVFKGVFLLIFDGACLVLPAFLRSLPSSSHVFFFGNKPLFRSSQQIAIPFIQRGRSFQIQRFPIQSFSKSEHQNHSFQLKSIKLVIVERIQLFVLLKIEYLNVYRSVRVDTKTQNQLFGLGPLLKARTRLRQG